MSRLEGSVQQWQGRGLAEEKIVYLYLDVIYPTLRSGGKVVTLPVLGVRATGEKVLLALLLGGGEHGSP